MRSIRSGGLVGTRALATRTSLARCSAVQPAAHRAPHRAGVDAAQHRRAAAFGALVQHFSGVGQIGFGLTGGQAPEHQHVVLRGVVVVRGQLVVEQVRDVQVHQRRPAQRLQRGLHLALRHLEFAARAGDPHIALGRHGHGQGVGFGDAGAGDGEDAHQIPCWVGVWPGSVAGANLLVK
jgi:hypothetical protein